MGKSKSRKSAPVEASVEPEETNEEQAAPEEEVDVQPAKGRKASRAGGIEAVIAKDSVQANIRAFCDFVVENGGPKINPKHAQIAVHGYKKFQQSDAAKAAREEGKAEREEARAAREKAREERRNEGSKRKQERAEARAAREAEKAEKAAASQKSAASASKPAKGKAAKATPAVAKGKAAAAAKPAKKGKGKAEKAPY